MDLQVEGQVEVDLQVEGQVEVDLQVEGQEEVDLQVEGQVEVEHLPLEVLAASCDSEVLGVSVVQVPGVLKDLAHSQAQHEQAQCVWEG